MHPQRNHVIWLNGAFGTGKTTAARLLAEQTPGAVIVDPEEVGALLRPVLQPVAPVRDFQEWPAWRHLVAATLNAVLRELPDDGPSLVIVPQTITVEEYWSEIMTGLDPTVHLTPVALHIDPGEHRRRVVDDTEEPDAHRWRLSRFPDFREAEWIRSEFTGVDVSGLSRDETVAAVRVASQVASEPRSTRPVNHP
ncbi:AAA family ATPase [Corynebacterium sp. USCH3]|uniref:AAA family ATPase n=1 Tax=Corynebacterium sp. USCH3 TaxID=3024840 RepID=UPI0030956C1C